MADLSDALKEAMLRYAPELEDDYQAHVRDLFDRMQTELGPALKGIYNSHRWSRTFSATVQGNVTNADPAGRNVWQQDTPYRIDEKMLDRNAKRFGEEVSLAWFGKMKSKLGNITDVTITPPDSAGSITITGKHDGDNVRVEQHMIVNVSILGTLYNQWPALIYVNGKKKSEAQYKKIIGITVPVKSVTQYKCGNCGYTGRMGEFRGYWAVGLGCPKCKSRNVNKVEGTGPESKRPRIDVESRPKEYSFSFMRSYTDQPNRAPELDHDRAKGMSPEEAQAKIVNNHKGWGTRLTDFHLRGIYAWNGQPIWTEKSGTPPPVATLPDMTLDRATEVIRSARKTHKTAPAGRPGQEPRPTTGMSGLRG